MIAVGKSFHRPGWSGNDPGQIWPLRLTKITWFSLNASPSNNLGVVCWVWHVLLHAPHTMPISTALHMAEPKRVLRELFMRALESRARLSCYLRSCLAVLQYFPHLHRDCVSLPWFLMSSGALKHSRKHSTGEIKDTVRDPVADCWSPVLL